MDIKIEKGIPPPRVWRHQLVKAMLTMEIGDSFVLSTKSNEAVYTAALVSGHVMRGQKDNETGLTRFWLMGRVDKK